MTANETCCLPLPQQPEAQLFSFEHNSHDSRLFGLNDFWSLLRTGWDIDQVTVAEGETFYNVAGSGDKNPPANHVKLDLHEIQAAFERDATIIVRNIELKHAEVARVAESLAVIAGQEFMATAFLTSPGRRKSTLLHHDGNDNLLVQTFGSKEWNVYAPFVPYGISECFELPQLANAPLIGQGHLADGDALFITAGVPHQAATGSVPSLHLSFSDSFKAYHQRRLPLFEKYRDELDLIIPPPQTGTDKALAGWCHTVGSAATEKALSDPEYQWIFDAARELDPPSWIPEVRRKLDAILSGAA